MASCAAHEHLGLRHAATRVLEAGHHRTLHTVHGLQAYARGVLCGYTVSRRHTSGSHSLIHTGRLTLLLLLLRHPYLQAQLTQCGSLIEDAQWDSLLLILPRIRGSPTNAGARAGRRVCVGA
jgi:hypothetical protein